MEQLHAHEVLHMMEGNSYSEEAVSNRSLRWPFLCLQKKSGKL